jgi:hypothetical protein
MDLARTGLIRITVKTTPSEFEPESHRRAGEQESSNPGRRRLLRPGKFAEQFACGLDVGFVSLLRRFEPAEAHRVSLFANCRFPFSGCAGEMNALVPGRVVARAAPVGVVLRVRREAKIVPAIVEGIAVAVIDGRAAPGAHHVEPCELMGAVMTPSDPDHPIPLAIDATGELPLVDVGRLFAPAKFSGSLIVAQQLAQARAGQSRTSFHGGLGNEKGPRKRPLGERERDLRLPSREVPARAQARLWQPIFRKPRKLPVTCQ